MTLLPSLFISFNSVVLTIGVCRPGICTFCTAVCEDSEVPIDEEDGTGSWSPSATGNTENRELQGLI